jgi:hypothetical protein
MHQDKSSNDNSALNKLIAAFKIKSYSSLTKEDLFNLVKQRILSPETATRLMKECSDVS